MNKSTDTTHATTWVSTEDTVVRETSQVQRDEHCMTPHSPVQGQDVESWLPGEGGGGVID